MAEKVRSINRRPRPEEGPEDGQAADWKPEDGQAAPPPTSVQPVEPEDAYLTGGSRSLQRRVLGLNVRGSAGQAQRHPETPAGQHATGSFTGTDDRK